MLEYISNGCGAWKIKTKSNRALIRSEGQAVEYQLDTDLSALTDSQINEIEEVFERIQMLESRNHEEGE